MVWEAKSIFSHYASSFESLFCVSVESSLLYGKFAAKAIGAIGLEILFAEVSVVPLSANMTKCDFPSKAIIPFAMLHGSELSTLARIVEPLRFV